MPRVKKQQISQIKYGDIFNSDMLCYYQGHIIEFVYDVIFQNKPEYFLSDQQKDLLLTIQDNKRVAAKSGKGVGKTGSISFAIIWFLCCFHRPKIVCTAPSYPTLKSALWPEISKWLSISLVKDLFTHTEDRLYLNEDIRNWWVEPRTAKDPESLQGLHEENLLVIADEASGIKPEIHDVLDTTLTGINNKYILIGNPTQVSGPFFDCFNKFKYKWITKTYSALESPFVQKEQVDYYEQKYGTHHDLYLVNILGEFPSGSPDAFIRLTDIHAAVQRNAELSVEGDIEIGVDVARFGDDSTVLYWRRGWKVYPAKVLPKSAVNEVVDLVLNTVKEIRAKTGYTKTIRVKIDDVGVGSGVSDYLKLDRTWNIEVITCNFGGVGNETYHNEASTMWGRVKEYINIIGLPDDKHLIEELSSRRWRLSPSGKIMIEPKSEYKKDFKNSPDRADALVLCFAQKANEKIVIKNFDPLDQKIIKNNLYYSGSDRYGSIYYSKDLVVSIIYSYWDGNKLSIYDEYCGEDSMVYIGINLQNHLPLKKIIGNDYIFGDVKNDLSYKFKRLGIRIQQNFNYNEISSIDTVINMIGSGRINILDKCKKTIEQLQSWKIDYAKAEQERSYGLCFALCNLVSCLNKKQNNFKFEKPFDPYKIEKVEKKSNSWMI
jgi:phage terminase large subunit